MLKVQFQSKPNYMFNIIFKGLIRNCTEQGISEAQHHICAWSTALTKLNVHSRAGSCALASCAWATASRSSDHRAKIQRGAVTINCGRWQRAPEGHQPRFALLLFLFFIFINIIIIPGIGPRRVRSMGVHIHRHTFMPHCSQLWLIAHA